MDNKSLELLDKALSKSESQEDRENIDTTRESSLVNFINSQIERSQRKNELKDSVINKLKTLVDEDENNTMTVPEFIKLLEILDKADNELILGVFNTVKDVFGKQQSSEKNKELEFTAEEVETAKKFMKVLKYSDMVKNSEGE